MSIPEAGLGPTVRAWRDRLSPAAAGLPYRRTRRAAGLRREDLAQLAGISVDYVVRLEQGRAANPSGQVVASLARALQLTETERDHLYRLAGLDPPADAEISDHIPPGTQRVLNRLHDAAVAVFAADWQLIWWNAAWAALLGDPGVVPPAERNFARDTFPVEQRGTALAQWPVESVDARSVAAAVVSDLRRASGRFGSSPRLSCLVHDLLANPTFAQLWATGSVAAHREDHKTVLHPAVGAVSVDCDVLTDDAERKVVILTTAPGSEDETKLQLALVSGVRAPASG
ncbi:helix-turn-helix transcriptional regulator [Luteipulveratus flavus]|uniref:Helix-turn-helix transcriptional regulator n=1 Tax=Luteipulveratus flavus TaxID=3031728 RepID=A0ABT6CE72_9MICO|nr:helix-turn-helix transcriptional regulator [Luteipulveratus sp. YIM 133296]MDF8265586.1 helix-turn-helix transcriptional regulator [Luteipulveratus sp. YIM 133296]